MIKGIHHVSMVISDTVRSKQFYGQVLGLTEVPRNPIIPFPGLWFEVGERTIHLLEVPNQDPTTRTGNGPEDRHVALTVESIPDLKDHLQKQNWPFVYKDKVNSVFIRDPDGNTIEFVQKT